MAVDKMGLTSRNYDNKYDTYYSGTDTQIFFGDLWVDEIVEIEWSMVEQVAPIYGYSSYTFDKVARGNRYVQGSFAINFKEVGYLQMILDSLSSDMKENKTWFNLEEYVDKQENSSSFDAREKYKGTSVSALLNNFYGEANKYEEAIWGRKSDYSSELNSRKDSSFFYDVRANANNKKLQDKGFNILLNYGRREQDLRGSLSSKTAQSIVGVQLTGVSQQIDPSGNPVREVYSFIAKDISGNVQKPY